MSMIKFISYVCCICGAVISEKTAHKKGFGEKCPFCHEDSESLTFPKCYKLKIVFDDITNIPTKDYGVDAVFVEDNGVSNPRMVVRFDDHYLNDWNSLKHPDNFQLVSTLDETHQTRPIELIRYFDVSVTKTDKTYLETIDGAADKLIEWVRESLAKQ